MFRRFLIAVLIFLIAVVVVVDRIGALVGGHILATKVQSDEQLSSRPTASIGGFPFLTQAIEGKYKNVTIKATDVRVSGVVVTTLTAHLYGVHVGLGPILHDKVTTLPVDRVAGTALVSFANINSYLSGKRLDVRVAAGGHGHIVLTDRLDIHGTRVSVSGVGTIAVRNNVIHIQAAKLRGGHHVAGHSVGFALPLTGLPFHVKVQSVTVSPVGVTGTGSATNIVLGSHHR